MPDPPRTQSDRNSEAQAALVCGEAFQRLAEPYLPLIPTLEEGPFLLMPPELGDVAACATNLAFAVELYLKALLTHLGIGYPKTSRQGHDLGYLYGRVPEDIRNVIESVYDQVWLDDMRQHRGLRSFSLGRGPSEDCERPDLRQPMALPDVLSESRDLFNAWRYVCEAHPMAHQVFHYDPLRMAAETLRVEATVRLGGAEETVIDQAPSGT